MSFTITPLRASAILFVRNCGFSPETLIKVKENHVAIRGPHGCAAWDVWVKTPGAGRGKKVGTLLAAACEPVTLDGHLITYGFHPNENAG